MNRISTRITYEGTLSKFLTNVIALVSMFAIYCSFNKESLGIQCILLTVILLLLNFKTRTFLELLPFIIVCGIVLILLLFSGQISVRGFNAPIAHALKFVDLMFIVALSIGIRRLNNRQKVIVIYAAFISIVISTIISLYNVIFIDKYAIRYYEARGFTTVIDFSQFYGICLLPCIILFSILSYYNKYPIRKYLLFFILLITCVVLSIYITGLLICIFGIVMAIFLHIYDRNKKKAIILMFIAASSLLLIFLLGDMVSNLIYYITESWNWIVRDRLRSVTDMVFRTNHNLVYSYDRRNELAGYSMNTFKNNPIFGIGYSGYEYGVIGCHQEWQDMLGVFGIVGTAVLIFLVIFFSKQIIKNINNKTDLQSFYIALILFIILGFLNPCLNLPVLSSVFIIAPNMSMIFPWWKKQNLKAAPHIAAIEDR